MPIPPKPILSKPTTTKPSPGVGSLDAARRSSFQTVNPRSGQGGSTFSRAFGAITSAVTTAGTAAARIGQSIAAAKSNGIDQTFSSGRQTTLPRSTDRAPDSGIVPISSTSPNTDGGAVAGMGGNMLVWAALAFAAWRLTK